MTTLTSHRTHRPPKDVPLTPLNRETSRAYAACEMTGGHAPSGETLLRQFPAGPVELPLCSRCGCPYNAPRGYWSTTKSSSNGGKG